MRYHMETSGTPWPLTEFLLSPEGTSPAEQTGPSLRPTWGPRKTKACPAAALPASIDLEIRVAARASLVNSGLGVPAPRAVPALRPSGLIPVKCSKSRMELCPRSGILLPQGKQSLSSWNKLME